MHTSIRSILASAIVFAADKGGNAGGESEAPAIDLSAALVPLMDETKVGAVKKELKDRELFPTLDAALKKLEAASAKTENLYGIPVQVKGYNAETDEIDSSIYEGQQAALAYIGHKPKGEKFTGIKAVLIFPVPSVDQFLATDNGKAFLTKVAEKEVALVAFRQVRDSVSLYDFVNGVTRIPANADEYATESRRGLDTDAFDAVWLGFKAAVKEKKPQLAELIPAKKLFLDALRSKNFAESHEDTKALEAAGWFVKFGAVLVATAENNVDDKGNPEPIDATSIKAWLEGRDTLTLEREGAKPKDFSVLSGMALDF